MAGEVANEKIVVVAEEALGKGFRLAGVTDIRNVQPGKESEAMRSALREPGVGILVTYDSVIDKCDYRLKKELEGLARPVVVTLTSGEALNGESLRALIKRALGFDLFK